LESIGSNIIISYLQKIIEQLKWDQFFPQIFQRFNLYVIPILNPVGMVNDTRSNGRGVDLMRNAPLDSEHRVYPFVGGHRLSPLLPWYRGREQAPMELEAQVLMNFMQGILRQSELTLSLDVHSGFGARDFLWYPFAHDNYPFPLETEVENIKDLLDRTLPQHVYHICSQAQQYKTHGDLWDFIYDRHEDLNSFKDTAHPFIPLTLELGSWLWIKKNPLQVFMRRGLFHPIKMHRYNRIMRRHFTLFDFLLSIVQNPQSWINLSKSYEKKRANQR
jgi:hypothetical protein